MSEQNEDGQEEHILDPYGEMVLLLDADPQTLREPIRTQDNESIRRVINILEDQINNTPLEGNEDLINRHLQVWFFCIRQLEDEHEPAEWTVENGTMTVAPGTGSIMTKQGFGDMQLHIEWRTPEEIDGDGQGRGNSGVFLMGLYEIQVLDSWQNRTYSNGQAGAIYKQHAPMVNASREPGEWQAYDIFFERPHFGDDGSLIKPAYVTVLHNGVMIHHRRELQGPTVYIGLSDYVEHPEKLPLGLQDHSDLVSFRNIWVREL